jgi:WD40 repeat protein
MPVSLDTCNTCGGTLDSARGFGRCAACLFGEAFDLPDDEGVLGVISGHELLEEIARGGMGVVYRARQSEPERIVALKTMRGSDLDSNDALERFRHEARAMADLEHSAILPVFTFGEHDGVPFFTMKLAAGGTLAQRLGSYAGKWRDIAVLLATIAEAVHYAHTRAVLHRDLKPANILFDEEGHAFVSDFGIAKLTDDGGAALTRTASVLGTPHYLAPEIAVQDARAATTVSDVWSLGVILYELLGQRRPFDGDSIPAVLRAITETEPAVLRDVPRDLGVITRKALAKETSQRFASAAELASDLRRWLAGEPIHARPVPALERLRLWARRKPGVAALTLALLVSTITAAVLLFAAYRVADAERLKGRESLRSAFVAQARFEMTSGRPGQRYHAIETLQRAAAIRSGNDLASEYAAALARPDLRFLSGWQQNRASNADLPEFTPDLTQCAVPEVGGGFSLRAGADGRLLRSFSTPSSPVSFAFAPDGKSLVVRLASNVLQLWAADGTAPIAEFPCPSVSRMADGMPASYSAALGVWAMVAPGGAIQRVTPQGEATPWLPASPHIGGSVRFDPAGLHLAVAHRDGVELWDMVEKRKLWEVPITTTLPALDWAPTGYCLAVNSGYSGEGVLIISAANGTIRTHLTGANGYITRLAFHPTDYVLAGCSTEGTLHLWDFRDGASLLTTPASYRVLRWSPDGHRLASGLVRDSFGLFEFAPDLIHHEYAGYLDFNHSATIELTTGAEDRLLVHVGGNILLWGTQARRRLAVIANDKVGGLRPIATPDGKALLYTRGDAGITQQRLMLLPGGAGVILAGETLLPGTAHCSVNSIAADGRWVVHRRDLQRWEAWPEGDPARATLLLESSSAAVHTSPDLHWGAIVESRELVKIHDLTHGGALTPLALREVEILVYSPDSRWLLASTKNEDILLEIGTWKERGRWSSEHTARETNRSAFSGDSQHLAVSRTGEAIEILSVPDLRLQLTLSPPRPIGYFRVSYSHDGSKIWANGVGMRLFEWDLAALDRELAAAGIPR